MSWACDPAFTSTILDSYQVTGTLFVSALQSFFAAQCALTGDHLWPDDATEAVLKDPNYDFIVVGAGSSGAVVANRLSENPDWKVLLVEAGGNPTLGVQVPQMFYNNMLTSIDWDYHPQPQEGSCRGYKDQRCSWPRGKVLGGSSSINAMFYVRGNKVDYDQWAAHGNKGWSYEEVLPYFLKLEQYDGDITKDNEKYHESFGPLYVEAKPDADPIENLIIKAVTESGLKFDPDINDADQIGITLGHSNIKKNYRFGTARAYLSPVKDRKNLHVMTNAYATQVLFAPETKRVSGILINKDGKDITVNAKKEVIVSGGSINSAQLLMLSGIGPKKHLEELGIEVKADLPVGEHLEDHVFAPIIYTFPGDKEMTSLPNIVGAFAQYILQGVGPFKDVRPHRATSFYNTTDPSSSVPDAQFHYLVLPPKITNMLDVFGKHRFGEEVQRKFVELNEEEVAIIIYNVLLHPKSNGKILLASKNPFDKPLIYADYFKDSDDMATLIRAMKQHSLKLGETEAFKSIGSKLAWLDLDSCKAFEKGCDEHLECIARELTFSLYHPTGTAKMGPDGDPTSVVDPELKVRQVEGLRVIDASIMPTIVRGNTNVPCIMIGEKGSDLIKNYWSSTERSEL